MKNMRKLVITIAAVALTFGFSPFAGAQTVDNGSAAASDHSKSVVKTDNSTYNKTKTRTATTPKHYKTEQ